MKININKA